MPDLSPWPTEEDLRQKHGGTWGEHPNFPVEQWKHEVGEGDTRQGYWSFVESAVEIHMGEVDDMELEQLPEHVDDSELCQEARDRVKERLEKGV